MPRHPRRKAKHAERRSVEMQDGGKLDSSIEDVYIVEEILKACHRRRWELEAEDAADEARGGTP